MNGQPIQKTALFVATCIVLAGLTSGCGGDTPVSPGVQPQIVNQGNGNFQFQVTAMKNYSGAFRYSFANAAATADVNQSSAVASGNVTLSILDANAASVYSRDLNADGSYVTSAGAPGTWTIVVTPSGASGDLNFRVDSRP